MLMTAPRIKEFIHDHPHLRERMLFWQSQRDDFYSQMVRDIKNADKKRSRLNDILCQQRRYERMRYMDRRLKIAVRIRSVETWQFVLDEAESLLAEPIQTEILPHEQYTA